MNTKENEIEIKPLGSYFDVDEEGYIVNPASVEKIQSRWRPVIDDVVGAYKQAYGEQLRHVYLRGSVAKGQAVEGVSDIDTFAYVDLPKEDIRHDWIDQTEKDLGEKYPFVSEAELGAFPMSDIEKDNIILNQSVSVWGDSIEVPRLKIGKELAIHSSNFHKRFEGYKKRLEKDEGDEETKKGCVWFMKGLLRVGFEITMERSRRYTRDLYRCYETFSEYYPEKEPQMREVLHLALNPTTDKQKIKEIMDGFGVWLIEETKNYF